jgi:hypothetical protein
MFNVLKMYNVLTSAEKFTVKEEIKYVSDNKCAGFMIGHMLGEKISIAIREKND